MRLSLMKINMFDCDNLPKGILHECKCWNTRSYIVTYYGDRKVLICNKCNGYKEIDDDGK